MTANMTDANMTTIEEPVTLGMGLHLDLWGMSNMFLHLTRTGRIYSTSSSKSCGHK